MRPIVYRDGLLVTAAGGAYPDIRYGICRNAPGAAEATLVLSQDEARELAAALAWIISEVDTHFGYHSFSPRELSAAYQSRARKQARREQQQTGRENDAVEAATAEAER